MTERKSIMSQETLVPLGSAFLVLSSLLGITWKISAMSRDQEHDHERQDRVVVALKEAKDAISNNTIAITRLNAILDEREKKGKGL